MKVFGDVDDIIIKACRESDKIGNPAWLEDLIDVAIDYAPELLEPEEWLALMDKLKEENY